VIFYTGDGPEAFAPLFVVIGGPMIFFLVGTPLIGHGLVLRSLGGIL
jgi:hypothetical protein